MVRKLMFLGFLMTLAGSSFADEQIEGFRGKDLPVLNEELRQVRRNINDYGDNYTSETDSSTSDETRNATSYGDTTLTISFTSGKDGYVSAEASLTDAPTADNATYAILVDGTVKHEVSTNGSGLIPILLKYSGKLSAGAHIIKVQFKSSGAGTVTMKCATTTCRLTASYLT